MTAADKTDAMIEEYKTLRAEILQHSDAVEKNIVACLTATGIALTFGLKESSPPILLLACVIPIFFWLQHRTHRVGIAKIAAYISVFLESRESQLLWETRLRDQRLKVPGSRIPSGLRTFFYPYPILLTTSILLTFWQFKALYSPGRPGWRATLFVSLVAISWLILSKLGDPSFNTLIMKWRPAFEELKSLESQAPGAKALPDVGETSLDHRRA
jgi:hypothetical protein